MTHEIDSILESQKKVFLITGVAGFIGSNILEYLLLKNQRVIGIDNFSTGSKENLSAVTEKLTSDQKKNFTFLEGDIRNSSDCFRATRDAEIVLHHAALGSVPRSILDPISTHEVNTLGFLNMIDAAKETDIEKFIFASSSSVYGDSMELPKVEKNIGIPLSPYALSKLNNEQYSSIYSKLHNFHSIGLRYFNVFGKRQNPFSQYSAVIPLWINAVKNNNPLMIFGDGTTSRDFCYIKNVIDANLQAALSQNILQQSEVFNIAYGETNSLNVLSNLIITLFSDNDTELDILYKDFRPGDIKDSFADISKARKMINYDPKYSLQDGLQELRLIY